MIDLNNLFKPTLLYDYGTLFHFLFSSSLLLFVFNSFFSTIIQTILIHLVF